MKKILFIILLSPLAAHSQDPSGSFFSNDEVKGDFFSNDNNPVVEKKQKPKIKIEERLSPKPSKQTSAQDIHQKLNQIKNTKSGFNFDRLKRITEQAKQSSGEKKATNKQRKKENTFAKYGNKVAKKYDKKAKKPKPASITLFISDSPASHVHRVLKDLVYLKKMRGIKIREINLVGNSTGDKNPFNNKRAMEAYGELTKDADIPIGQIPKLPKELNAQGSPLWIVSHMGENYLFEGNYDLLPYFSNGGFFDPNAVTVND